MDQAAFTRPGTIQDDKSACPACGSSALSEEWINDEFEYGNGKDAVQIVASLPLCHCANCGLDFTDWRAEELRYEAVCEHFNLLSPKEIVAIRDRYEITQQQFSEISRFGRASLARWECGSVLQNGSSDSLIYLLGFEENLVRLKRRAAEQRSQAEKHLHIEKVRKFRALSDTRVLEARQASTSFHLFVSA